MDSDSGNYSYFYFAAFSRVLHFAVLYEDLGVYVQMTAAFVTLNSVE